MKTIYLLVTLLLFGIFNTKAQLIGNHPGIITVTQYNDSLYRNAVDDTLMTWGSYCVLISYPPSLLLMINSIGEVTKDMVIVAKNDTIIGFCERLFVVSQGENEYRKILKPDGYLLGIDNRKVNAFLAGIKAELGISLKQEQILNKTVGKDIDTDKENGEVFSTWLCGYAAVQPDMSLRFEKQTNLMGIAAARKWLHAKSFTKRCYAINYLYERFEEGKYKPTKKDLNAIYNAKLSVEKIEVCGGCMFSTNEVRRVLLDYDFLQPPAPATE